MLAIGYFPQFYQLLLGNVGGSLALRWEDTVGGFVAGPLAKGNSRDDGALGYDLVGPQPLLDVFRKFLGEARITAHVEGEQFFGFFLRRDSSDMNC